MNDARKSEVADLADGMTKAAFVLWRENLDLHLEEFSEFGLGINDVLKRIRLHTDGTLRRVDIQNIYGDLKRASQIPAYLIGCCDRAHRELYKFLHKKLTVKLKAASVMTCQPGEGFELYRMINKRLDPNNQISEHTILADIRRLAFMKCKNLDETKLRVVQLISLSNEFVDKVGREIDAKEKTFAVWMFMDEDTKSKAERSSKELVEGTSTFTEV